MDERKSNELMKCDCEARQAHTDWVAGGQPVDGDGHPRLNRKNDYLL